MLIRVNRILTKAIVVGSSIVIRVCAAALMFGMVPSALAQPPMPPPQAANAGFVKVIFNSNFANTNLSAALSCAGKPQNATWKQGMWWEGQNSPNGVAPCSQIAIVYDSVFKQNVLDLAWTATGNTDEFDATTISTFPLDIVSPHFAFRYGYVEAVLRVTPMATGVWPAFWAISDNHVIGTNTPPFQPFGIASEIDIFEAYGPQPNGKTPIGYDAMLHEYYSPVTGGVLASKFPPSFDITLPHTYGLLWTSNGVEYQGGQVCAYVDNVLQGCQSTTAATEAQDFFLNLSMGVGCNYNYSDRSCLNGLSRADMLVSRVTVWHD